MSTEEVTIAGNASLKVSTPYGLVYISCLDGIGAQIMTYTDPEKNPTGYLCLEAAREVRAPFTPAQQDALNAFQRDGRFHPFTCPDCDFHKPLFAERHWRCMECGYTQYWAHSFMANPAGLGEAS